MNKISLEVLSINDLNKLGELNLFCLSKHSRSSFIQKHSNNRIFLNVFFVLKGFYLFIYTK